MTFARTTFGSLGLVAFLAAVAIPTAGATTPAAFTLAVGGLSISAPSSSVNFGTQQVSNSSQTITGSLGAVTVSDQRGGVTTWTASVISTAFTPGGGPAVPASDVSYDAGSFTASGVVATKIAAPDLTGVTPVVSGASGGISTVTWNPTISILVPANFAAGVYIATITHSVA
jgi:hypothetical protein